MRIALFAAGTTGVEIVRFLENIGEPPVCLVLNAKDPKGVNTKILEITSAQHIFNSDELLQPETVSKLRQMSLDLGILVEWLYILREPILSIPRLGFLNFHIGFLPYCRGVNANFWAIVEEKPFGVTIHWVNQDIDAGDIAFQAEIPVTWEDTGETLYKKAEKRIVQLFIENYPKIKAGNIPRIPQAHSEATFHRRRELHPASRIELDKTYTARQLLNLLRARTFPPHPGCWFEDRGERYQIRISIEKISSDEQKA